MNSKKITALLIALCMAVSLLAGCGSTASTTTAATEAPAATAAAAAATETPATPEPTEEPLPETRTVLDAIGNEVEVPYEVNSMVITSFKGAFDAAIELGLVDKVSGMAQSSSAVWLYQAMPQLADIKDYGKFNDVNVEEILQDEPDVVISPEMCTDLNNNLKELGIAVAVDGHDDAAETDVLASIKQEKRLVADLCNAQDALDEYNDWEQSIYDLVNERVGDIPDEERVRVVPVRTDENQVFCNNYICGYVVELAGGINLCGDLNGGSGSFYVDCDGEQWQEWDPDIVFKINFYGAETQDNLDWYENLNADPIYGGLKAFQNGDVYLVPQAISSWQGMDPLGVLWMAKIMYPDRFEDVDVKAMAEEHYSKLIGRDLTDEDWAVIAPQFTGANYNGLYEG